MGPDHFVVPLAPPSDPSLAAPAPRFPFPASHPSQIFASHAKPNYSQPWQVKSPVKSTSSGFIIDGRIIVTNAHSVAHATLVQVRRGRDSGWRLSGGLTRDRRIPGNEQ